MSAVKEAGRPSNNFGRHEQRRAGERRQAARVRGPHAAEVHQNDASADLTHDVVRLDVAVEQSRSMKRRERPAQIDADTATSRALIVPRSRTIVAQRLPLDELHPDADLLLDELGSVDGDDIRVAHAREMTRLVERRFERHTEQDLQRDFAIELSVPRTVDGTEGSLPHGLQQDEMPPGRRSAGSTEGGGGRAPTKRPVRLDHRGQPAKPLDNVSALGCRAGGHDGVPVDPPAVTDIVRKRDEPGFVRVLGHDPWRRRGGEERG